MLHHGCSYLGNHGIKEANQSLNKNFSISLIVIHPLNKWSYVFSLKSIQLCIFTKALNNKNRSIVSLIYGKKQLLHITTLSLTLMRSSDKYNFLLKIFNIYNTLFLERVYKLIVLLRNELKGTCSRVYIWLLVQISYLIVAFHQGRGRRGHHLKILEYPGTAFETNHVSLGFLLLIFKFP